MLRRRKQSKRRPNRIKWIYLAILFIVIVPISGWIMPFSGVFDLIFPPEEPCTLADQIKASNKGEPVGGCTAGPEVETYHLYEDIVLSRPLPAITSAITIMGNGHKIDGDRTFRIFIVNGGRLNIHNLTLTRGYGHKGGAIRLRGGAELMLHRGTVSDSSASYGGAIASERSSLTISESKFINNRAIDDGGAIYVLKSSIDIIDSQFFENSSHEFGGGVRSVKSQVRVQDSLFENNDTYSGGAFSSHDSKIILRNSPLENNRAYDNGGAFHGHGGSLTIDASNIVGNWAQLGSGIYWRGGAMKLRGTDIDSNSGGNLVVYEETGALHDD